MSSLNYDFDLFVIGGGSGGVRSARWAASWVKKSPYAKLTFLGVLVFSEAASPKK